MPPPVKPKIYHITHVNNLASIIGDGELLSDATIIAKGGPHMVIGMSEIKLRRLKLPVTSHAGSHVGDYVPFYFCTKSVMLYLLHKGNHPGLAYRGGQDPVVHLEADLQDVVDWADGANRRWAFSLSNAGAFYTQFRSSLHDLGEVNWEAVAATQWSAPEVKEGKQAEFLVESSFPWDLVSRIGVRSVAVKGEVEAVLHKAAHKPQVLVKTDWYY